MLRIAFVLAVLLSGCAVGGASFLDAGSADAAADASSDAR